MKFSSVVLLDLFSPQTFWILFNAMTFRNVCIKTSLVAQAVKLSTYSAGDLGLIPGSGRSPEEGNGRLAHTQPHPPQKKKKKVAQRNVCIILWWN